MINAQHAHIYRIHTLYFIFGEIFFLKILSIQPLPKNSLDFSEHPSHLCVLVSIKPHSYTMKQATEVKLIKTWIQSHIMWIIWCHLRIVSSLTRTLLAKAIYPTTMTVSTLAMSVGSFVVFVRVEKAVIPVSLSDMMSNVKLSDITYVHHQFMLIYATECGIGHASYEYIFSNLRSTTARSNTTQESVNSDERCDGWPLLPPYTADQQQHLLLLSNGSHNQPMPFGKSKEGKGLELHICTMWVCLWKVDYIEEKKSTCSPLEKHPQREWSIIQSFQISWCTWDRTLTPSTLPLGSIGAQFTLWRQTIRNTLK